MISEQSDWMHQFFVKVGQVLYAAVTRLTIRKGLANIRIHFCSAYPQNLASVDNLLIGCE